MDRALACQDTLTVVQCVLLIRISRDKTLKDDTPDSEGTSYLYKPSAVQVHAYCTNMIAV